MKYVSSSVSELLLKIKSGKIKSLLLYGINSGLSHAIIEQIEKKNNLLVSEVNIKDITVSKLKLLANSRNFFKQKELIKITGVKSVLSKEIKNFILEGDFEHIICFYSNENLSSGGIRAFFEQGKNIASIGCYYENENTIAKVIFQQCKKYNKNIDEEALYYLRSYLKGDNMMIKSELNKILNFTNDKSVITKHDALAVLSSDLLASGDEMCIFLLKQQIQDFLNEVRKLKEQGKNEIIILRAIARYIANIYFVNSMIEEGENIDKAIKSLSSPIFYKYIQDFKQIVRKYTTNDAIEYLGYIQESEMDYKKNPASFDLFFVYMKLIK